MKNPVLALFGTTVFFVTPAETKEREVKEGTDLSSSLLPLVEGLGAIDLIYQPTDLQLLPLECANVGRAKLKKFLAGEIRELANPITLWGATKPQPLVDGKFATIVHYEARPRLEAVLQKFEEAGVQVRTVLPPTAALVARTFQNQLELAILGAKGCFLLYHVNELGTPSARLIRNAETLSEHLGVALTSRKHPPTGILLVADEPAPIADLIRTHGEFECRVESWPDFVRSIAFPAPDPANLALRPFRWKPQFSLSALAAVLVLGAGLLTYDYATKRVHARRVASAVDQHRRELERDVTKLEETETRYHAAETVVTSIPIANPRPSLLLDAITSALPPAVQVQAYRYQAGQFTIEGMTYEGVGQEKGPFAQFLDALNGGGRPWVLKSPKAALVSSNWNLTGTLNP